MKNHIGDEIELVDEPPRKPVFLYAAISFIAIISVSILIFSFLGDQPESGKSLSNFGQFISGILTPIALIVTCMTTLLQSRQLDLYNKELMIQRVSHRNQLRYQRVASLASIYEEMNSIVKLQDRLYVILTGKIEKYCADHLKKCYDDGSAIYVCENDQPRRLIFGNQKHPLYEHGYFNLTFFRDGLYYYLGRWVYDGTSFLSSYKKHYLDEFLDYFLNLFSKKHKEIQISKELAKMDLSSNFGYYYVKSPSNNNLKIVCIVYFENVMEEFQDILPNKSELDYEIKALNKICEIGEFDELANKLLRYNDNMNRLILIILLKLLNANFEYMSKDKYYFN